MSHNYTPLANLSASELLLAVANKAGATDLEIELALRLEATMNELSDAEDSLEEAGMLDRTVMTRRMKVAKYADAT